MSIIRLADLEDYELKMNGLTAALFTYLINLDFPYYDVNELRDRIFNDGHKLIMENEMIIEITPEDLIYIEWNEYDSFKQEI